MISGNFNFSIHKPVHGYSGLLTPTLLTLRCVAHASGNRLLKLDVPDIAEMVLDHTRRLRRCADISALLMVLPTLIKVAVPLVILLSVIDSNQNPKKTYRVIASHKVNPT